MLRLLRSCRRAPYQILGTSPSGPRGPGRHKAGGPRLTPGLLAPGPGFEFYHPSPCCFKKKVPAAPPRPPPTLTHLPDAPRPALCVALTGLVPLAAPPLVMLLSQSYVPVLAFAQMAYGASLLAFLGGVRWGFTLPAHSPAKPDLRNLACGAAPLVFSWYALLISEGLTEAVVMVVVGLGVALHHEIFLLPHYPDWFKALRIVVTLVAFLSLVATLVMKDFYPETGPKRSGQAGL